MIKLLIIISSLFLFTAVGGTIWYFFWQESFNSVLGFTEDQSETAISKKATTEENNLDKSKITMKGLVIPVAHGRKISKNIIIEFRLLTSNSILEARLKEYNEYIRAVFLEKLSLHYAKISNYNTISKESVIKLMQDSLDQLLGGDPLKAEVQFIHFNVNTL